MTDMTSQEAAQRSIALVTAITGQDFDAAYDLCGDMGQNDTYLVFNALCGTVSALLGTVADLTGHNVDVLRGELLTGIGERFAQT